MIKCVTLGIINVTISDEDVGLVKILCYSCDVINVSGSLYFSVNIFSYIYLFFEVSNINIFLCGIQK